MNKWVEIAVKHPIHIADRQFRAVIFDQAIRREHVTAYLAAEVNLELAVFELLISGLLLLQLILVELGAKLLHGTGTVFMLGSLVLALHDDAGRQVREAHRRFGAIDMLAAGPAGAKNVDLQIVRLYVDLDVLVDLRIYENRSERGVPARIGIKRRNANQAVNTDLRLQLPVDVLAADFD